MRNRNLTILFATLLYSFLFYRQPPGINLLIFSSALVGALIYLTGTRHKLAWWAAASGVVLSSVSVMLNGSAFGWIMNVLSLAILSALTLDEQLSVLPGIALSIASFVTGIPRIGLSLQKDVEHPDSNKVLKGAGTVLISLVVFLVFFLLYRSADAVFDFYAAQINFDFISVPWCFFSLLGFCICWAFFRPVKWQELQEWDTAKPNALQPAAEDDQRYYPISLEREKSLALLTFSMLNLLLLFVNLLDIRFLILGSPLPAGVSYTDMVHQGVGSLIISIIFAVALILFFFRDRLNFVQNKPLIYLACGWVLQNAFMVLSTAWRNALYIHHEGLTNKRVGVYFYLLLCGIGLVFTLVKLLQKKSNWYLFRVNGWAFWAVLVAGSLVNWTDVIVSENFRLARDKNVTFDVDYNVSLGTESLPYLVQIKDLPVKAAYFLNDSAGNYHTKGKPLNSLPQYNAMLTQRISEFRKQENTETWKSWTFADMRTEQRLKDLGR
jgi:hypothetical protein